MPKFLLLFIIGLFLMNEAKPQSRDTIVTYYKFFDNIVKKVNSLDSADYFQITYPPDSTEELYNIKQFYKNGTIKFVGKFKAQASLSNFMNTHFLEGNCVRYYPNGKKSNMSHYDNGKIDGLEYFFNTNGRVSSVIKWADAPTGIFNAMLYWECYDNNGNVLCENGNGKWIVYDKEYKNIVQSWQVKNGYQDGKLYGIRKDSIKYECDYKNGALVSGVGYDKTGTSYPFKNLVERANYNGKNVITFIRVLNNHLILPKDNNGRKINIDTAHIIFIVEKDGRLTHVETYNNNPELKVAVIAAVAKCENWIPSKFYGIPFRTRVILPLKITEGYSGKSYVQVINGHGEIIHDDPLEESGSNQVK